ncbi:MAG: gluconeogenesis factor YvcK family protein [Acidimicrobiales bacterium]
MSARNVVCVGGGHGLAITLRAARTYATDLTAIVSVADDGGSSGRIRDATGLPAMGDIRRCLSALADPAVPLSTVFEYRFAGDVEGHALGNLLIAALADRTGNFTEAVGSLAEMLGVRAAVLPATDGLVVLCAEAASGTVRGQVAVQQTVGVEHVWLDPVSPPAPKQALDALAGARQIVLGPGSLFTSVLAALAVPDVRDAVAASAARRVYVCNLRPQRPETSDYDVAAHVAALRRHGVEPDIVVCHPGTLPRGHLDVEVLEAPIAASSCLAHDPELLAGVLGALCEAS